MKVIILAFFCLFLMNSWAWAECATHEVCAAENICQCLVPAEWGFSRNYYVDFSLLQKGHHYLCQLSDSCGEFLADITGSQFPAGLTYEMPSESMRFPLSLFVNTTNMENSSATMIIKYFVPPSDVPSQLTVNCTMQE